jgi:hypothetical protein
MGPSRSESAVMNFPWATFMNRFTTLTMMEKVRSKPSSPRAERRSEETKKGFVTRRNCAMASRLSLGLGFAMIVV